MNKLEPVKITAEWQDMDYKLPADELISAMQILSDAENTPIRVDNRSIENYLEKKDFVTRTDDGCVVNDEKRSLLKAQCEVVMHKVAHALTYIYESCDSGTEMTQYKIEASSDHYAVLELG